MAQNAISRIADELQGFISELQHEYHLYEKINEQDNMERVHDAISSLFSAMDTLHTVYPENEPSPKLDFFAIIINEGEEDQNSCTFAEFIRANTNEDGGLCEEFAQIADLHIGQSITLGGGAAPTYTVKRIS